MTTINNAGHNTGLLAANPPPPRKQKRPAKTESRALRNQQARPAATQQRVPMMAHELYMPPMQPVATLPRVTSRLLGVIVPAIGARHFPGLLQGIERAASRAGFSIIICQSADDALLERHHVSTLLGTQVAGLLVAVAATTKNFQHFDAAVGYGIPLVYFDNAPANSAASSVATNDHSGGYQATQHLLDQGCTRIAHLAGRQHLARYRQRRQGYLDALANADIPADEHLICYSDLQPEDGAAAMRRLLRLPAPPTGVVGASHNVMAGALKVLKSRKIAVPRQIALASCSNEDSPSPIVPALTSVDQRSEEMGWAAVGLLLEKLGATDAPFVPRQVMLHPRLVMRESSGGVRSDESVNS